MIFKMYIFSFFNHYINGDNMEENINALDELHKGSCMGMDAIHFILDKVEDESFKKILDKQYQTYKSINEDIEKIYPKYNEGKPHSTGAMTKAMTYSGIEMKTMNDTSNSKIAELLIQGTNMGIIEGRRILNNKKVDEEVEHLVDRYVGMQEKYLEVLKKYL